jgi:hypothetical protein
MTKLLKTINKSKGILGGLLAEFAVAVFVVLFVIIFIFCFKIHVTQSMVDYYLWNKEYDIPLALFSIDINEESSAMALNRVFYKNKFGYDEYTLKNIIDKWFIEPTDKKTYQYYRFELGDVVFEKEVPCNCKAVETGTMKDEYECRGNDCGSYKNCPYSTKLACDDYCKEACQIETIQRKNLGLYPSPIIYNGTNRVVPLKFNTIVYEKKVK